MVATGHRYELLVTRARTQEQFRLIESTCVRVEWAMLAETDPAKDEP